MDRLSQEPSLDLFFNIDPTVNADKQFVRAGETVFFRYFAVTLQTSCFLIFYDFVFHSVFENKILLFVVVIQYLHRFDAHAFYQLLHYQAICLDTHFPPNRLELRNSELKELDFIEKLLPFSCFIPLAFRTCRFGYSRLHQFNFLHFRTIFLLVGDRDINYFEDIVHKHMLRFQICIDNVLVFSPQLLIYALLIQIVRGVFYPAEAEKMAIFSDLLKQEGVVRVGLLEKVLQMSVVLLFFQGLHHRVQGCDEIELLLATVTVVAVSFVDIQLQSVKFFPEAVDEVEIRKLLSHFIDSGLSVAGLSDHQQEVSGFYLLVVMIEKGSENTHQNLYNIVVFLVDDVKQVAENDHLLFLFQQSQNYGSEGHKHVMLVDPIESSNQNEFFRLTDILGVHSEVNGGPVLHEVFDHGGSDDCELVGEIDVARAVGLYLVDIDEVCKFLDDGEVHIPHVLFEVVVLSLNCLEGMYDPHDLFVFYPELLPYLTFYHVGVSAFLEQVLVVVQNQLVSLHRLPLHLLLRSMFSVVLVSVVEIGEFVDDVDNPLIRGIRI